MAQQKPLGSLMTEFGKRRSLRVTMKKNKRILKKIWLCSDIWMDTLPFFDRPQLGLKLALLSPRFNALVDKHFDGKTELTLWKWIEISKIRTNAKVFIERKQFPLPKYPMPNKIRFNYLQIEYIDHFVLAFIRANQQTFNKGTNLTLYVPSAHNTNNVQQIWNDFVREIWPIFAPNIRHLNFVDGNHLDNLRRHTSPTVLTDLIQLNSIDSENLLPDSIADDGPNSTAGQALTKWLNTPTKDGKPKQLHFRERYDHTSNTKRMITSFKEAFLRATTSSASYIIRIGYFEKTKIGPFELVNERTKEMLTLVKEENNDANVGEEYDDEWGDRWVLKRCQIGQTATVKWVNKKTNKMNTVKFHMHYKFGPLSPPVAGQMNEKGPLEMNAGPSG